MKKVILVATLVITMLTLSACGSKETNTLIVATNGYFEPYEFYDSDKELKGIDIEIAQEIAYRLGKQLVIEDMEFDTILTAVSSGKCDTAITAMSITDERRKIVNFSDTYATAIQQVIVKEDSNIKTLDDLNSRKIGVQAGTTGDIYAVDDYGNDNISKFSKLTELAEALKNDKIEAIIIDDAPAKSIVDNNEGLRLLDTYYTEEEYAIAVNKDKVQLLNDINTAIDNMKTDGTIDAIISKYIN